MIVNYKFVCLSCNKEVGRAVKSEAPPAKCRFCGGSRIATQPLQMDDRTSLDFDVVIFNKTTGTNIKSGFTLSPKEYVGVNGDDLKKLFAKRLSEALGQMLNTKTCYDLITNERK